jgi:hypothetical protein
VFYSLKLDKSKKMKTLSMQLFLVVILAMTVNAWHSGEDGQVNWDTNCDFNDPTFPTYQTIPASPNLCGRLCIADPACQYFGKNGDGLCYLKVGPGGSAGPVSPSSANDMCGYVIDRI